MKSKKTGWGIPGWVVGFAAILSIISVFTVGGFFDAEQCLEIAKQLSPLLHGLPVAADQSSYPCVTVLTISSQWLFFPLYIGIWIYRESPFGETVRKNAFELYEKNKSVEDVVIKAGFVFVAFSLGFVVMGRFPFFNDPEFFDVHGRLSTLPFKSINESKYALAFYAWLTPLMEAAVTWTYLAAGYTLHLCFSRRLTKEKKE